MELCDVQGSIGEGKKHEWAPVPRVHWQTKFLYMPRQFSLQKWLFKTRHPPRVQMRHHRGRGDVGHEVRSGPGRLSPQM